MSIKSCRLRSSQTIVCSDQRICSLFGVLFMNLRQPNANEATGTVNRSRSVSPSSGICTRCLDGCKGSCEIWLSTFRGREVLYPGPFGELTAGVEKNYTIAC